MNASARYSQSRFGDVIVITDNNDGARSVTNAAEDVVAAMARKYDDLDRCVIVYRDTEGRWDALGHARGAFTEFQMIGGATFEDAMAWAQTRLAEVAR